LDALEALSSKVIRVININDILIFLALSGNDAANNCLVLFFNRIEIVFFRLAGWEIR
jgi:hypothetical protein